jgi:hypothetical protein
MINTNGFFSFKNLKLIVIFVKYLSSYLKISKFLMNFYCNFFIIQIKKIPKLYLLEKKVGFPKQKKVLK